VALLSLERRVKLTNSGKNGNPFQRWIFEVFFLVIARVDKKFQWEATGKKFQP